MSYTIRLALTLGIICIIAAFALGGVYELTKERIELERERVMKEALKNVLPRAKHILQTTTPEGEVYFRGFATEDTSVAPVGYAVVAYGKEGYSSTIQTLVGVEKSGEITGIEILFQQETPGLGAKAEEVLYGESDSWFQRQFKGKSGIEIAVDKDGGEIKSITGATITSRAITKSIKSEVEWLMEWLKKEGFILSERNHSY